MTVQKISELMDSSDVIRLRSGDEAAFKWTYELYSERVYRLAFRFLKDHEQSEEIVQDVFLNLWISRANLDENGNMWLYLYVIAKRSCLNALRKVRASAELFQRLQLHISELNNVTEEKVIAADIEHFTEEVISKLPRQQQLVYRLSRGEGLSYKDIAEKLNISQNTVRNHMVEALKTIKASFRRSGLFYLIILYLLRKM